MSSQYRQKRVVYQEFGKTHSSAVARAVRELPPQQQHLRIQTSKKGRKGKTVTIISGFQCPSETLANLLKQIKIQCGSGGTIKENLLEVQGDHAQKLLPLLAKLGYQAKISGG
ncbi:MAG: translation initiation factor [Cyanophyceae cyanobacterium]